MAINDITYPTPAGPNALNSDGSTINVSGHDNGNRLVYFTIFEYASSIGPPIGGGTAYAHNAGFPFSGSAPAWGSQSVPSSGLNKFFSGSDAAGSVSMFPFHLDPPSGTWGGGASALVATAWTLKLDTPFEGANPAFLGKLNQPAFLIYSADPNFVGSWYSLPLEFGGKNGDQAVWKLTKTAGKANNGSHTWSLRLLFREGNEIAFRTSSRAKREMPFPITLKPTRRPVAPFRKLPESITLSPAP
jgi:hypothetical protein